MISKKLAHQSLNRLQVILGQIELALLEETCGGGQRRCLDKAKKELLSLSQFIRESTES